MTEYDYSPEAMERHLATQQRIARWVDHTGEHHPFVSLPSKHSSSAHTSQPKPKPAFYATPQGVISPTYSSSRKHGNSQRPSRGTPSITMPQESVAIRPSTTPQGPIPSHSSSTPHGLMPSHSSTTPHGLIPSRSSSTPPAPVGNFNSLPSTAYESLPSKHSSSAQTSQPQPKPAFYAVTPHGVISPTYSSSRKHGNSQPPSSRGTPSIKMPQEPVAIGPSSTSQGPIPSHSYSTPQGLTPTPQGLIPSRSSSTPPAPVGNFNSLPSTPYLSYPAGSQLNPSPHSSPHQPYGPYPTGSPLNLSPHSSPRHPYPTSHPSYSQTSFHSAPSPRIHTNPVVQQQYGGTTYPYFQPAPQPTIIVNRRDGGCVVVAPPGQNVQVISSSSRPVYKIQNPDTNGSQSFFGKFKTLGAKSSKSKKSKGSTSDRSE